MSAAGFNPAAKALLDEIEVWADRVGCTFGELGTMVLNHPGFVPLLRKRGTLKEETRDRLQAFMRLMPDADSLPADLRRKLVTSARADRPWAPERHGSMMIRLGYPALAQGPRPTSVAPAVTGGGKPRVSAAVIRAAKLDGRDLPTFVTALIDMGLECWRDDRAAHGEVVA